jgi:Fe-S-cluster containining protein
MKREGLRFECTQCGECCVNRDEYAHVYADRRELRRLAELLEMTLEEFRRRYAFVDEDGWTQLAVIEDHCVFLDMESGSCRVYAARPIQCRTFPFWKEFIRAGEWTARAYALCEGVGSGRLYTLAEAENYMSAMEDSDEDV